MKKTTRAKRENKSRITPQAPLTIAKDRKKVEKGKSESRKRKVGEKFACGKDVEKLM